MKVLIIEDETRAANHLIRLLKLVDANIEIIDVIESVNDAISFLQDARDIDLILSDIQLADGLSFEIYEKVKVKCPIIFTTAYDQYAIDAFKTNGIDYLLKPIEEDRLKKAFDKAQQFLPDQSMQMIQKMLLNKSEKQYKSRFMVKAGDRIKTIAIGDIAAFYSQEKATYLFTKTERSYAIDYSLDEISSLIDNQVFFKVNRKFIISIDACTTILAWSNSRLKLSLSGVDEPIIVAREKVQDFKKWLDR